MARNVHAHLIHDYLGPPTDHPKRHLNRVSRFSRIHGCYKRTDRQNEHRTRSVRTGRLRCAHRATRTENEEIEMIG